jgi:tRNA G10  N-methylase Trm11
VLQSNSIYEPTEVNTALGRMVTARANRDQPIYRWFVYPHSFTREFVHWAIEEIKLVKGSVVMDPFLGAGTTILSCKELGIPAIGFDLLPLSVLISNVKVSNYRMQELRKLWISLKKDGWQNETKTAPDIPVLSKGFDCSVLRRILAIQRRLEKVGNKKYSDLFLVGLLSVIGHLSKTEKGGGWLRFCSEKVVSPEEADRLFINAVEMMISDLEQKSQGRSSPSQRNWRAYLADARDLPKAQEFDAIISSPPYLNRHDYTRIFSLELALGFLKNHDELKDLRYRSLRSHVEAKKTYSADGYKMPTHLATTIEAIQKLPINNDRIPAMVAGYFEDLFSTLQCLYSRIRKNGHIVFVLGNVRFAGVLIPVDEIVAELGEQIGLNWLKTVVARLRGNSAQQMGRFGRELSRESVIIWRK